MITATTRKMPRLGSCDYSVIILSRSHPTLLAKYTATGLQGATLK